MYGPCAYSSYPFSFKKKKYRKFESAEFYHQSYHRFTDIYCKWPTESGLVGQSTAIESEGSLLIAY